MYFELRTQNYLINYEIKYNIRLEKPVAYLYIPQPSQKDSKGSTHPPCTRSTHLQHS